MILILIDFRSEISEDFDFDFRKWFWFWLIFSDIFDDFDFDFPNWDDFDFDFPKMIFDFSKNQNHDFYPSLNIKIGFVGWSRDPFGLSGQRGANAFVGGLCEDPPPLSRII